MNMKVFLINSSKTWGGGEKWHLETACSLKNKGFDVAILARRDKDLYKRSVASGITTRPISISNLSFINPYCLIMLVGLFKKEKPDAIILNFSADIKTAGIAAKIAGIRNIIYRRGSAIPIRNTWINRMLYSTVISQIIANSEETKRTILQNNPKLFPPEKITVIYNGIDLVQFDQMPTVKLCERGKDEIIIGNAGRLVLQKGQKHLIEMAVELKKHGNIFKILVAGDGPLEASLKKLASDAGVEDNIMFLGFVDNVKAFMETIDVFVLTSVWEGFGYVLVEAMACKKPVVAFHISSNPEIVAHNETGYLVKYLDIKAFTAKVTELILDPVLREKWGKAGRKRVEDYFEIGKNQHQVELFLRALTGIEQKV